MTNIDIKIMKNLSKLREFFGVGVIKLSTEDEGLSDDVLTSFSMLVYRAGMKVAVKIGGCEAKADIRKAGILGVDIIISPMIQSKYDVKKFVTSVNDILPYNENVRLGVNIETSVGIDNLEEIMSCAEMKTISSIIVGRTDLLQSMNLGSKQHNSDTILKIIKNVSDAAKLYKKEFFVGGGMSVDSIEFLKKVPVLSGFETRNVIFSGESIALENISEGLMLAHELELLLLEKKTEFYYKIIQQDDLRKNSIKRLLTRVD